MSAIIYQFGIYYSKKQLKLLEAEAAQAVIENSFFTVLKLKSIIKQSVLLQQKRMSR
jgi:hypothetical protein